MKGSFGSVYKGVQLSTQNQVAIKVIAKDKLKVQKQSYLIWNEIDSLKSINHPNLLRLLDLREDELYYYLITE